MVRHLPSVWETWVRSLGREDHLEKGMAIHSCTLAWKIPWSAHGVQKRHIQLSNFTFFLSFFLSYSDFNYPALMYISILTSISLISGLPRWLVTKNPPANSGDIETRVRSLGWEDPLEVWQPTPVFLPGDSHRQRRATVHRVPKSQKHNWSNLACTHMVLFQRPYLPSKYLLKRKWRKSERKGGKQEKCRPDLCQALGQIL